MVTTRRQSTVHQPGSQQISGSPLEAGLEHVKTWSETAGTGDRHGAWGLSGPAGAIVAASGAVALMVGCPAFAVLM